MSVRIVRHRKRIILYYSLNGKKLQMPLGIEVKVDAKGVGIDWDDKRDQLKGNAENYEAKAEIIEKIRKRANDIVFRFKEEGIDISPDLLKSELEKKVEEKVKIKTTSLVSEYEKFFKEREKIIHESEDMTDESARNYRNVFHALKDYEKQNNTVLTLSDVATTSWLNTFNVWLKKPRPKGYLTKGGLDKDSVKKRFIFLGAYLREQKEKGIIQSIHFLNEFMKKEFKGRKGEKKYKTTLTVDEIYKFYNANIKADYFSRSRDYFVFCCLTGMRFSDFQQIDRTNLYNENGVRLIRKKAHKTRHESAVEFEVPLVEVAYEIFKKYNFKFPTISNQKANAYLEKALKESKMFDTETPLFREDFSDEEETSQFLKRYEIISFHTGRHSFITNLIDTTPIPVLMRYTGHSKIETLMGYVKQRDLQTHYISALELNK